MAAAQENTEASEADTGTAAYLPDVQAEPAADHAQLPFPIVAVGASAGGVEALQHLFGAMPADSGCAFVVLLHLSPDARSQLVPLLARVTAMPVAEAQHDQPVQPNHVYVMPPAVMLEMHAGRLQLKPAPLRPTKVVDRFMASLAADQRDRAIAVVLSGTDGDGAIGVKAIKSEGGMVIAQLPGSAAHPGMPSSAVATGVVDRQLPVEEMPAAIVAYVKDTGLALVEPQPEVQADLAALLEVLRRQVGLDFRAYKQPMLRRRVRRRMGLTHVPSLGAYIDTLLESRAECDALAADFLISVTEFFREPEAWETLARDVVPQILEHKQLGDSVRVWVPGCATGEEAYSVAMLMLEDPCMDRRRLKLQVFATDVDSAALEVARKGRYAKTIEATVSAERLRRFFTPAGEQYQVRKELRDAVTFAPQNLASDPPFSRMDLVSCRNLLIYLEPELQRRVLQMFHFSLLPHGFLALGKSETVGPLGSSAFRTVSQAARIFRRAGLAVAPMQLPRQPWLQPQAGALHTARPPGGALDYAQAVREALLEHRPTTAVLTNREGEALYFYGPVRKYIEFPQGSPTTDLFAMLDASLRPQLRAAVHMALNEHRQVETTAVAPLDDGEQPVRMVVSPVAHPTADDLLLVTFEDLQQREASGTPAPVIGDAHALRSLEEELRATKRDLRSAIEELEAANEELKVANEEAMSTNEELQSTNEELETSQEELQSVNEELTTVNHQLQSKVEELERVNDDLNNLLASTSIPTLFLDRQLHIKRFTPATTRLFSLIPSDLNRPLTDIASHDDTAAVVADARAVLERLSPLERETRTADGRHYLRRTLPYRTQEDRIDGVVITFIDVTDLKQAGEGLRRFAAVMQGSSDAILVHGLDDGHVLAWNRGAEAMYGYSEAEALQLQADQLLTEDCRERYHTYVARAAKGELLQGVELRRRRRDGSELYVATSLSLIRDDHGAPQAVSLIERDITPQKEAEAKLRESEQRFRALADTAPVLIWMSGTDGMLGFANHEFAAFTGTPVERLVQHNLLDLVHADDRGHLAQGLARLRAGAPRVEAQLRLRHVDGPHRWMKCSAMLHTDPASGQPGVVGSLVDIDAQVRAEESLHEASRHKDEFLAMLGHELRNPLAPIRNAAEVLHRMTHGDQRLTWVHDVLVRQVSHVTRLVDDLLDISLITRGTMQLRLEPVNLTAVLERVVEDAQPLLQRKHHQFQVQLPKEPVWVEGDQIRLQQVFENLLTNAAKYTDDEGRIAIRTEVDAGMVVVRVIDSGLGIPPEMRQRIFDLFVQDERAIDRSQGGLGIGLALVKHLVSMHRGTVEAFSPGAGQGCEFRVHLPCLRTAPPPQEDETGAPATSGHGRVLVVDDDRESSESMRVLLQLFGYEVESANDLDGALRSAARLHPQVAVLDIAMPGADGYEVARRLRAMHEMAPGLRVVGMSGFGRSGDFERSKAEGFAHHFVKPVDPTELDLKLRELVAQQTG